MNRQKKIETNQLMIETWYAFIRIQGYFDYRVDYDLMEWEISVWYPTVSKTYIHNAFWKHVYFDKDFLNKYKYK
jgi:hypothetical protein